VPFVPGFRFDTIISLVAAVLILLCTIKDRKLKRWAGALMLLTYAAYFFFIW
jgi:Ca2+/Na+ antiporter